MIVTIDRSGAARTLDDYARRRAVSYPGRAMNREAFGHHLHRGPRLGRVDIQPRPCCQNSPALKYEDPH
ncbi:hypothetical protein GCM10020216_004830 [Nonomuraea helvata]